MTFRLDEAGVGVLQARRHRLVVGKGVETYAATNSVRHLTNFILVTRTDELCFSHQFDELIRKFVIWGRERVFICN